MCGKASKKKTHSKLLFIKIYALTYHISPFVFPSSWGGGGGRLSGLRNSGTDGRPDDVQVAEAEEEK